MEHPPHEAATPCQSRDKRRTDFGLWGESTIMCTMVSSRNVEGYGYISRAHPNDLRRLHSSRLMRYFAAPHTPSRSSPTLLPIPSRFNLGTSNCTANHPSNSNPRSPNGHLLVADSRMPALGQVLSAISLTFPTSPRYPTSRDATTPLTETPSSYQMMHSGPQRNQYQL